MSLPVVEGADFRHPEPGHVVVNGSGNVRRVVRLEGRSGLPDVVYEALRPRRENVDVAISNQARERRGAKKLGRFEHVCWIGSWKTWARKGKGTPVVLSEWSDGDALPVVVSSARLKRWMLDLDKASGRLEEVANRLIDKGLDPDMILNGAPGGERAHPLFSVGGECGRVYCDIGDVLRESGASNCEGTTPMRLSELERRVVLQALQVLQRVHLGQAEHVFEPLVVDLHAREGARTGVDHDQLRALLEALSVAINGMPNGGPGLYSPKVADEARVARRIEAKMTGDTVVLGLSDDQGKVTR